MKFQTATALFIVATVAAPSVAFATVAAPSVAFATVAAPSPTILKGSWTWVTAKGSVGGYLSYESCMKVVRHYNSGTCRYDK